MDFEFKDDRFNVDEVSDLSVDFERDIPYSAGDGARHRFTVSLVDGRSLQVGPESIIEPEGNTDIYYRDKDPSWSALMEMSSILHYSDCRWYASDAAKRLSQKLGIPMSERST